MTAVTQPCPPALAAAISLLDAVLGSDIDDETHLAVSFALVVLTDVHPPYEPEASSTQGASVDAAREALRAAAADSTSVEEAVRIGLAAAELRGPSR